MKVYNSSKKFPKKNKKSVVALGNFDGVHLAHCAIFKLAIKRAKKLGGISVAYTFEPHPVKVLSVESAPKMLNTLEQRLELLAAMGLDATVVEPFDLKFAKQNAKAWFEKTLVKCLHASEIITGYDFTFGTNRSGTTETLEELCKAHNIPYHILTAQMTGKTLISSSQIRLFVRQGDVDRALELLGRPYFIDGKVIKGFNRGKALGFPTANLQTKNELIPKKGVYACKVIVGKKSHLAVANIGNNPTFGGQPLSIEAHILHFNQNLYNKTLRLNFIKKIRDERLFMSSQDLAKQIELDFQRAKEIL